MDDHATNTGGLHFQNRTRHRNCRRCYSYRCCSCRCYSCHCYSYLICLLSSHLQHCSYPYILLNSSHDGEHVGYQMVTSSAGTFKLTRKLDTRRVVCRKCNGTFRTSKREFNKQLSSLQLNVFYIFQQAMDTGTSRSSHNKALQRATLRDASNWVVTLSPVDKEWHRATHEMSMHEKHFPLAWFPFRISRK